MGCIPYTYRIFHRHLQKYITFNDGRGFRKGKLVNLLFESQQVNRDWGGTQDGYVIELHRFHHGELVRVFSIPAEISLVRAMEEERKAWRAARCLSSN